MYLGTTVQWNHTTDPHLVAGVLKSWLCAMDAPLLTEELHDSFIAAQGIISIILVFFLLYL